MNQLQDISIRQRYNVSLRQGYKDTVICAGTQTLSSIGTCEGDSGSPLMIREPNSNGELRWSQAGIVSGGIAEFCGSRDHPTRVVRLDNTDIQTFIQRYVRELDFPTKGIFFHFIHSNVKHQMHVLIMF